MSGATDPFGDEPFSVADGPGAGLGRGAMAGPCDDRPYHGVRERVKPARSSRVEEALDPGSAAPPVRALRGARRDPGNLQPRDGPCALRSTRAGRLGAGCARLGEPSGEWTTRAGCDRASAPESKPAPQEGIRAAGRAACPRVGAGIWHWEADDLVAAGDHLIARRRGLATCRRASAPRPGSCEATRMMTSSRCCATARSRRRRPNFGSCCCAPAFPSPT